jgi:hypothetical protein
VHLASDRSQVSDFGVTAATAVAVRGTPSMPSPGLSRRSQAVQFRAAPPTVIQIPVLKVSASIERVASIDGQLSVPQDPETVGWWAGAALPGSQSGTVVLDGHVDSATHGIGAFFRLTELRTGDVITLTALGGQRVTYQVTGRRFYTKAAGLPAELFASHGPSRLVLITCGGRFDKATLSYRDNVVLFAAPTSAYPGR